VGGEWWLNTSVGGAQGNLLSGGQLATSWRPVDEFSPLSR